LYTKINFIFNYQLVAGSAIQAFEEVCPERIDLIHKNYRRLCNLLIDVDEWGQIIIINMLTRYARTQFLNPHPASENDNNEKKSLDENKEENEDDEDDDYDSKFNIDENGVRVKMDQDHRLLLKCTKSLFQSRNSAVVMAVAQLYYYVAPKNEVQIVAKSLIRLLRSYK
jgi:AP-3 complex subunit beta